MKTKQIAAPFLLLAVALVWGAPAVAAEATLTATDDSFTHNADHANFGRSTHFRVKWDDRRNDHMRIAFIKFDLSAYRAADLTSASLELTTHAGGTGSNFVYRLWGLDPAAEGNDWSESTITGANRPAAISIVGGVGGQNYAYVDEAQTFGGKALLTFSMAQPAIANQIVIVGAGDANLLAFLNAAKRHNGGAVTFILHKDKYDGGAWGHFHSKEDASNKGPVLNVTTVPAPRPASEGRPRRFHGRRRPR